MLYIRPAKKHTKENLFLESFLETKSFTNHIYEKGLEYSLIQEPFTGLGYTDLVVVIWSKEIYSKWHPDRNKLMIDDIKILHHLYVGKKYKQISDIKDELGFSEKSIKNSLSRLNDAGLIIWNQEEEFKTLKKSDIFYLKEIISIEAKLKDWNRALEQAINNSYHSSESYILFPEEAVTDKMLETYKKSNIGIISFNKDSSVIKKSKRNTIPSTLNSWLFNEFIGRSLS
jgi:predicted transcriptional regulator